MASESGIGVAVVRIENLLKAACWLIVPRGGIRACPIDQPCSIEEHVKGTGWMPPSGTILVETLVRKYAAPRTPVCILPYRIIAPAVE